MKLTGETRLMLFDGGQRLSDDIRHLSDDAQHLSNEASRRKWNIAEEVFASEWEKANKRSPGLNGGFGTLELLLNDSRWAERPFFTENIRRWRSISKRDAIVAATVIQWLGTNCGCAFVGECERQIERLRKEKQAEEAQRRKLERERATF